MYYNAFSTGLSGLYFGGSWRRPDYSFRSVYAVPNGTDGAGASNVVLVERSGTNWNLEAGYSYRAPLGKLPLRIQIGITGPIHRGIEDGGSTNQLRFYRYPNPLEVRLSLKLGLKTLIRRRHPLDAHKRD